MKQNNYLDSVLIKLRRKYSKDEVVAALNEKLSKTEFNFGILKSDYEELLYKYELLNNAHKRTCERLKDAELLIGNKKLLSDLIQLQKTKKDTITKQKDLITELRKTISYLCSQLNSKK